MVFNGNGCNGYLYRSKDHLRIKKNDGQIRKTFRTWYGWNMDFVTLRFSRKFSIENEEWKKLILLLSMQFDELFDSF